jgi:hypothetical protein
LERASRRVKQKRQASADFLGVLGILRNVVAGCCIRTTNFGDFGARWGELCRGSGSESPGLATSDGRPESDALPGDGF